MFQSAQIAKYSEYPCSDCYKSSKVCSCYTHSVCVTGTGSPGHSSGCTQSAVPPAAVLGKVVKKLQDSPCKRIILIAPGWPNMPWFWDLAMSSQIPLSLPFLPNRLTQPFNQIRHRNLTNLNLHAWVCWPKRVRTVWPQWLYQPWPQLWIGLSSLTGLSVRSEHYVTTWTGPQTSGRIKSWYLSPLRKVLTKTSHLPLSPHGSNRQRYYFVSSLTRRPTPYIRLRPMMSGPSRL